MMSVKLGKAVDPANLDAEFDAYFSIKCQGPSYVKNSRLPDDMRWDRLVLVKVSDGNIE